MYTATLDGSVDPPRTRDGRVDAIKAVLDPLGIFPRRFSHASSADLTVTTVHVEFADAGAAAGALADSLDWRATEVAESPSTVRLSTRWTD